MTARDARKTSVRVGLTVLIAGLSACSHQSIDVGPDPVPAAFVAYLQSGEISVFHQRDLVTLSGDLQYETGRVTFDDLPPDANVVMARLSADGQVAVLAWSPDPRWSPYPDNGVSSAVTVEAYRLPGRELLFQLALPNLQAMDLSQAGDLLAVYVPQYNLGPEVAQGFEVYAVAGGALLWSSLDVIPPFALSPDGTLAYAMSTGDLAAWDSRSGDLRYRASIGEAGGAYYGSLAVSPDGATVIGSGSLDPVPPGNNVFARFTYRHATDGQFEQTFPQVPWFDSAWAITISPAGDRWAAVTQNIQGSLTPAIQVRDAGGMVLYNLPASFDSKVVFSPDGQNLAVTKGGTLGVYRTSDGTPIASQAL